MRGEMDTVMLSCLNSPRSNGDKKDWEGRAERVPNRTIHSMNVELIINYLRGTIYEIRHHFFGFRTLQIGVKNEGCRV